MNALHIVGPYQIETSLGAGQYTETYQATDTVRRRPAALKVLKPGLLADRDSIDHFLELAQLASELVHPHIAWVWETGADDGVYYLAERYINGPSLSQILAQSGRLSWERAFQIVVDLAQALDFARARGWVHGAVKPQNILVSPDLGAVLTDFGLARAVQNSFSPPSSNSPLYTAPEIWQDQTLTPAADQYALACIMVEMLSGQALFDAPTNAEIRTKHLSSMDLPADWNPDVPWQVEIPLKRALDHDPGARYPSASDFASALEASPSIEDDKLAQEIASRKTQAQAKNKAQAQAQVDVEEAARLAALEQARREIEEQVQRELEKSTIQTPVLEDIPPAPQVMDEEPPAAAAAPLKQQPPRRGWLIWLGAGIVIVVLLGLWLGGMLPVAISPTATPSATTRLQTTSSTAQQTSTVAAAATAGATAAATAEATATITAAAAIGESPTPLSSKPPTTSATPTITRTATNIPSATITPTPSTTPTITRTPTVTRTPSDKDGDSASSNLNLRNPPPSTEIP